MVRGCSHGFIVFLFMHIFSSISRGRVIALLAAIFLLGSSYKAEAQVAQSYTFLGGVAEMLMGSNQRAIAAFQSIVKLNPTHAPSYYYLSRIAYVDGKSKDAKDYIERALKIDSNNSLYLELYAMLQIQLAEYANAIETVNKARILNPKDRENYTMEIALLQELKRYEEAFTLAREYEQKFGIDDAIEKIYSELYISQKDYFGLLTFRQRLVDSSPDNINYILSLAEIMAATGNYNEALRLYSRAIEIDSESIDAYSALANFHRVQKNTEGYIEALQPIFRNSNVSPEAKIKAFEEDFFDPIPYRLFYNQIQRLISNLLLAHPNDRAVRELYGRYLLFIGDIQSAEGHYKAMVESGGFSSEVYKTLLDIKLYREEFDQAIEVATLAAETFNDIEFLQSRAIAYWLKGDAKTSLRELDGIIGQSNSDSLNSALYGLKGDIYHGEGLNSKAFSAYKKALKYNADNTLVLNNYAYYLAISGKRLPDALEMAERANELSVDNPTYLDTEAWVLFLLGRYVDAQLLMSRVMKLDENPSGEVLIHYGDILYALGDDFLARDYWKKALEAGGDNTIVQERLARPKAKRIVTNDD